MASNVPLGIHRNETHEWVAGGFAKLSDFVDCVDILDAEGWEILDISITNLIKLVARRRINE